MNKKIIYLRFCYWLGILLDFIVTLLYIISNLLSKHFDINLIFSNSSTYISGNAAALMFGWTALLFWANRKPVKRRSVLLLTVLVVSGLLFSGIFSVIKGQFNFIRIISVVLIQIGLIIIFISGYIIGGKIEKKI